MNKIIIFDFNRTLYDPESNKLLPNCKRVLIALKERKYHLYLLAMATPSRNKKIETLGLNTFFEEIILTDDKNKKMFNKFISLKKITQNSFVVGDRVKKEIALGNHFGLQTIWLKRGKFSSQLPANLLEKPKYTVTELKELLEILP